MKRPTDSTTLTPEQFIAALAALGWKQTDFARKTGVTAGAVSRWATGRDTPPLWATAYLGAMQDLKALHTKYLDPAGIDDQEPPARLAHLLPGE